MHTDLHIDGALMMNRYQTNRQIEMKKQAWCRKFAEAFEMIKK